MLVFPPEFIERYKVLTDFEAYRIVASKFIRKSIRANTIKISVKELKLRLKDWNLEQIPWCKEGFWIPGEKRNIGHLLEHQLGYIYVQEAASMLPPVVLDPKPFDIILDACASPGSKTTQIAAMMQNKGLIIANDKGYQRLAPLSSNLQRCGVSNAIVTMSDARFLKGGYKKILLDAPCTASGTIRGETQHSANTLRSMHPKFIKFISNLQKQLLLNAYNNLLAKNGVLIYSTCSLEPEEDEEVIDYLLKNTNAKLEKIDLKIKSSITLEFQNKKYSPEIKKCIKLWPQFYDTEGFFIAKIKKS